MSVKITVLVENTAGGRGLLGEHGLSFLLETESSRILFDTGQGMTLTHNAQKLGISLENLQAIVLSHGHYDHSGGMPSLLPFCQNTDLFLHPQALVDKFSPRGNIGFSLDETTLKNHFRRLIWTETPTEIDAGIFVTGTIPRIHSWENTGGNFWHDSSHTTIDHLDDDQALYFKTPEGLVVVLGCAHAGVINTLDYISSLTDCDQFYAVIGGMHLLNASEERLSKTVECLAQYKVKLIGANHCTGMKAIAYLWEKLGQQNVGCLDCRVGTQLIVNS